MKKTKILLLPLIALSIVGCSKTSNSNSTSSSKSEAPISQNSTKPTSTNQTTDAKDTGTTTDSTGGNTGTGSLTTDTTTPSDSVSVDENTYENTRWPKNVKDTMNENLNGTILPFADLGKSNPTCTFTSNTLEILGANVDMTETRLNEAQDNYEKAGYTVTINGTTMTATNTEKGLTVTYFKDSDPDFGVLTLTCVYKEPFDINNATGVWDSDLVTDLNSYIGNHADYIPYVYLGKTHPTYTWAKSTNTYTITGGNWDDSIIANAETAFETANSSIQNSEDQWDFDEGTNSYGKTLTCTITCMDKCKLVVSIATPSTTLATRTAKMTIKYTEAFDPDAVTNKAWPTEMQNDADTYMDGHLIPYFYIGKANPSYSYVSSTRTMTLTGGVWNDQVLSLAKIAFKNENATISNTKYQWTLSSSGESLTAEISYMDGCGLTVILSKSSSNIKLTVKYTQGYVAPDGYDEWASDIKTLFSTNLGSEDAVPYVYLNTALAKNSVNTATWTATTSTLLITGGTWYDAVLNGAYGVFTKKGWTASIEPRSGYQVDSMIASKVIDATTGKKIVVTIYNSSDSTTSTTHVSTGLCRMQVVYYNYEVPTGEDAKWTSDEEAHIKKYLSNHTIPYIYLNTKNITMTKAGSNGYFAFTGGLWNDLVLTNAQTALSSWTDVKSDADNCTLTANYIETDGCELTLSITKNSTNRIYLKVSIAEKYSAGQESTWNGDIQTKMKSCLNDNVIPFIDFGTTSFNITGSDSTHYVTLKTACWDDVIINNAKTALTTATSPWTIASEDTTNKVLYAYVINSDNSSLFLKVFKSSMTGSDGDSVDIATLTVYYYTYTNSSLTAKTVWDDDDTTFLNKVTKNHADKIPFINLGGTSDNDKYTLTEASGSSNAYIKGTEYDYADMLKSMETLKAAGYTISNTSITAKPSPLYTATYTDKTEGYKITLSMKYTQSNSVYYAKLEISYEETFEVPSAEESKWSDDFNTKVSPMLDGFSLPFVYLGTLDSYSYSNKAGATATTTSFTITGGAWNDQIFDLAQTAFTNANDGWTTFKSDYDASVFACKTTATWYYKVVVKANATTKKATLQILKKKIS